MTLHFYTLSLMMEAFTAQIPAVFNFNNENSTAVIPPYQPMYYWPTQTTKRYGTEYNIYEFPNPNPTSMNLSGAQQKQMNASQQPSPQPTQQDFIHGTYHHSGIPHSNIGQQNDRQYKCDQCPRSFARNGDLKRHKRIHSAAKPFPCGHCEKRFSRKDTLNVRSLFDLIRRLEARDS
jgi:uncharacterized Zn-finger protein